jgi:hypothetical protein
MVILVIPPIVKDVQTVEQRHDNQARLIDQNNPRNTTDGLRLSISVNDVPELFMSAFERRDFEMQEPPSDTTRQLAGPAKGDIPNVDNVSSFSEKTFPLSMRAWGYLPTMNPLRSIPKSVTKEHYELYLDHFHHRWPVIHIPSFEKGDDPYVLTASVEMIGAWLQGSCSSKMVALTLHDRLTNHIFQRLVCTGSVKRKTVAYI